MKSTAVSVKVLVNSTMLEELCREQPDDNNDVMKLGGNGEKLPKVWSNESIKATEQGWDLTKEETDALRELGQNRLVDVWHHALCKPDCVVRHLRAQYWDVDKAETMFRNMLQWRRENEVDEFLNKYTPPAIVKDNYPGAILKGLDYENDPVYMSRLGVTDLVGFLREVGPEEMYKFEIYKREAAATGSWLREYEKKHGRPVKQIMIIEDMQGLNRHMLFAPGCAKYFEEVMRFDQDNYCEVTKKIFVLRAPSIFRLAWSVAKHFFDPIIREKIIVTSPHNYVEVLSEYMDPSILPRSVYPEGGKGAAVDDEVFSPNFEGGRITELIETRAKDL